jgi:anti-sigma factor RsiW
MTCPEVQAKLSLYLYGELDFAEEERLEEHAGQCAACERALAREKAWHTALNAERADVPLELLEQCRQDLRSAAGSLKAKGRSPRWSRPRWLAWLDSLDLLAPRWSMRLAVGSFLVFVGFSAAQLLDRRGFPGDSGIAAESMGMINPLSARIREVEPADNNRVRIVFDQEHSISGAVDSAEMRAWLLAAARDEQDPGIRVDSVEMLNQQAGSEVRDALLDSARNDPNAAVRLKAVEGLARYREDAVTLDGLVFVLEHDENAGVRSKAIDVLAPLSSPNVRIGPDLAGALADVMQSAQQDDYVRARCAELLRHIGSPLEVY